MAQFNVGDLREKALPRYVVDAETGDPLGSATAPLHVTGAAGSTTADPAALTFGALGSQTAGDAAPAEVLPANAARRAMFLCNISDVPIYFALGSGALLTTTTYAFKLDPGQAAYMDPPQTQQGVWAIAGAAAKLVAFQEAV